MKLDDILTTDQVAKLRKTSPRAVRWAIEHGHLPATRIGGSWVITRKDAERWERRPVGRPRKKD